MTDGKAWIAAALAVLGLALLAAYGAGTREEHARARAPQRAAALAADAGPAAARPGPRR
jgi:hypothetical protein